MESVGMEKIIPLEFITKKKRQDWPSVFEWTEHDGNLNLWDIRNLISFLHNNYFEYTTREITLDNGERKTVWNLQKFGDKMLCPFWFEEWENLCYRENEDYSFVFFRVLCCEPSISTWDYATVIDPQTGEERYEVQWWEAFSKSFIIWMGITKEAHLQGRQHTWYLFHMTKGQNSMAKAAWKLMKKILDDLWYKTTFEIPSESQDIWCIWDRIKKLVLIKKVSANANWGWDIEQLQAELTIKSTWFFRNAIEWAKDLVGKRQWERNCLVIMDEFWGNEDDVKMKAVAIEWWREKRYSLSKEWDSGNEQIIANLSKEIAYTEDFFTINVFANHCLDYVNS